MRRPATPRQLRSDDRIVVAWCVCSVESGVAGEWWILCRDRGAVFEYEKWAYVILPLGIYPGDTQRMCELSIYFRATIP